jgi:hypothetical protein
MSQTTLPTMAAQRKEIEGIIGQIEQAQQAMAMLPPPQAMPQSGPPQPNPQEKIQQLVSQGQQAIRKIAEKPTLDQVLKLLKDSRMKSFVLDIETDSTIIPNEQAEKQQRTEFVSMLAQLLPQLGQLMAAQPKTAEFCGEILKFSVAPFRAGRTLDGAVDALVEQMKAQGEQPQPDSPATQQNKTNMQIEQMKDQTDKEKIKAENDREAAKLKQQDDHKKLELQTQKDMKAMELQARGNDSAQKQQETNLKMMHSREEHQQEMVKTQAEVEAARQKTDLAVQQHSMKMDDMAARQDERRAMQQFKMTQPPPGSRP